MESYQGRGVFIANGSASPATDRGQTRPDAALRALRGDLNQLAERVAPFRERIPGARWTRGDGWHVTLKFLGKTFPGVYQVEKGELTLAFSEKEDGRPKALVSDGGATLLKLKKNP